MGRKTAPQALFQNVELKQQFIDEIDKRYTKIENGRRNDSMVRKCYTIFGEMQLGTYENLFDKDLYDFSKEELLQAYSGCGFANLYSIRSANSIVAKYMEYAINISNSPCKSMAPATSFILPKDLKECLSLNKMEGKYMTKEELYIAAEKLLNDQDAIIPLLLWHGICGKSYSDLINLKEFDFNHNDGTVNVNGEIIKLDDITVEILIGAINEQEYLIRKKSKKPKKDQEVRNDKDLRNEYLIYSESPYILKPFDNKDKDKDEDALKPLSASDIKNRMIRIKKVLKNPYWTPITIYQSGIATRMLEEKGTWSDIEIKRYLAEHNIKASSQHMTEVIKALSEKINNNK